MGITKAKYHKAKWIKYSNKFFPKWVKAYWTIQINKTQSLGFYNIENAFIYEKLMEISDKTGSAK